ncbi:hypothetical protein MOBT1_001540 [Malassezia obtusa]|uniref:F-box domain-containing protein n=1 Tax=Malassezia obtusa TaxID=76774 RepID=A0AAF0IT33_9BASI|nr:hypothetical protein MOBT1_001540 [Malassezia obtusa]
MAKRRASSSMPRGKRAALAGRLAHAPRSLLELSDECLLLILSHLEASELARVELVCTRLARLSREGHVWKQCFVRDFVAQRAAEPMLPAYVFEPLFSSSEQSRALARLPAKYRVERRGAHAQPDWRRLYLAWRNWHRGRIQVSALGQSEPRPLDAAKCRPDAPHEACEAPTPAPRRGAPDTQPGAWPQTDTPYGVPLAHDTHSSRGAPEIDTLVQASANLIFTARRTHPAPCASDDAPSLASAMPPLYIYLADTPSPSERHRPLAVLTLLEVARRVSDEAQRDVALARYLCEHGTELTDMRLDQEADAWAVRLCLCFRPGILVILSVAVRAALEVRVDHVVFVPGAARARPVRQSAFSGELLVTCTDDFRLQLWHIGARATLVRALRSASSRWPACLALRPLALRGPPAYQVTVTYATPRRGGESTVTLQELRVQLAGDGATVTSRVAHAATPTASGAAVTSVMYDDPYIVVGTSANVLDVYRVEHAASDLGAAPCGRALSATPRANALRIVHCRTLHGHTSRVCSVALSDGRCVSGASDGSVRIWSMRPAPGEHVATLHGHVPTHDDRGVLLSLLPYAPLRPASTLAELARELRRSPGAGTHGVIRHVSAAFDKILCVTAGCRDAARIDEQVQVWHFAS